ncbi:MAG: hypothetical protein MH252_15000 [Thermosynechococcaceae cyanobacterium MS004]|nr:hypothetical protein [Thermosynechococcaceae cyanobacterium MS004]
MNDFNKAIDEALNWLGTLLYEGCEGLMQEMEDVAQEVEIAADELLTPFYGWLDEVEELISDSSRPFVQTVSPVLQDHPACVGCAHYHGEVYGEHLLVCAMYPYGTQEKTCPDWQSVWTEEEP